MVHNLGNAKVPHMQGPAPSPVQRYQQILRDKFLPNSKSFSNLIAGGTMVPTEEVCSINDSFARLLKMIVQGNVEKVDTILSHCPEFLEKVDDDGKSLAHIAAENGRAHIVDLLIQRGLGASAKDPEGNTPLHLAAMTDQSKTVRTLLSLAADLFAKNAVLDTPLHSAVRFNAVNSLEHMLEGATCPENIDIPGWHDKTPLHIAALMGHLECAKLLLARGAKPGCGCKSGLSPLHAAAFQGSAKVLRYLLDFCRADLQQLLEQTDEEGQTALHWAVNNGSVECVRILLEYGAKIESTMYDRSTPLHLASSQGLLPVVEAMHTSACADFTTALSKQDTQGMTPLHRAIMFNHTDVAGYLLAQAAGVNDDDKEGRTPLILAASRGSWACMALLIQKKANPLLRDKLGRNFLHYYISQDCAPVLRQEDLADSKSIMSDLLDDKDVYGCTPLHYAAKSGFLKCSNDLVRLGASVHAKDKYQQSPLHFAAKYGRFNTVKRLVETTFGFNIINDTDHLGYSPLHLAAGNGHTRVVKLLMSKGALIQRTQQGQTPLHLACAGDYRETVQLIALHYSYLVDCLDKDGNTGLHLAAASNSTKVINYLLTAGAKLVLNQNDLSAIDLAIQEKNQEATTSMIQHDRWMEIFCMPSTTYGWPVLGLVEYMPEAMEVALDRCITKSDKQPWAKDFFVKFDYGLLEPEGVHHMLDKNAPDQNLPLKALNAMVRHERSALLSHPVCGSYLTKKWLAYGLWAHGANCGLYVVFLLLLTFLVEKSVHSNLMPGLKHMSLENVRLHKRNDTMDNDPRLAEWMAHSYEGMTSRVTYWLIIVFAALNILKEVVQIGLQRAKYFCQASNYLEWFLYTSTLLFAISGSCGKDSVLMISQDTKWQLGACAIFLAWFNFMLYLQRFGVVGVYVVMFLEILHSLIRAIIVFMFLLLGFVFAFDVLLPTMIFPDKSDYYAKPDLTIDISTLQTPHSTVYFSFLRVINMMLGEMDAVNNYITPLQQGLLPYPNLTMIFLVVFITLMPILLMNLLIGLAVGDIGQIQQNATLQRLAMQVELHTSIEKNLPKWYLKRVAAKTDEFFPNRASGFLQKFCTNVGNMAKILDCGGDNRGQTPSEKRLHEEMDKQRRKLKEVYGRLDQQNNLLRLMVQKMEIHEEADQLDESANLDMGPPPPYKKH